MNSYLGADHRVVRRILDIRGGRSELETHLTLDHGLKHGLSIAESGKIHLLAHAVETFPELRELIRDDRK